MKVCLAFVLVYTGTVLADEIYCNSAKCNINTQYYKCNPSKEFSPTCEENAGQVILTDKLQQLIVDLHNMRRSQVATGKVNDFPTASKMQQLTWDNDLAHVAGFNVRQCKLQHDCSATKDHPFSGQNLALNASPIGFIRTSVFVENMLRDWFKENKYCSTDLVNNYGNGNTNGIEHFAGMIQQRSDKIGCAIAQYTTRNGTLFNSLIACNYNYMNMVGEPIYSVGLPCSECVSGCSTRFPGLCSPLPEAGNGHAKAASAGVRKTRVSVSVDVRRELFRLFGLHN